MPVSSLSEQIDYFSQTVGPSWDLSLTERAGILGISGDDSQRMNEGPPANGWTNCEELANALIAIHSALYLIYAVDKDARGWLRRPNSAPVFGGLTPLQVLMHHDLDKTLKVASHVQSAASGDFS